MALFESTVLLFIRPETPPLSQNCFRRSSTGDARELDRIESLRVAGPTQLLHLCCSRSLARGFAPESYMNFCSRQETLL